MNRNMETWLTTTMAMGMQQCAPVDSYCEKNGRHCTSCVDNRCARFNVSLETTGSLDHKRCDECQRTIFMIGRVS